MNKNIDKVTEARGKCGGNYGKRYRIITVYVGPLLMIISRNCTTTAYFG